MSFLTANCMTKDTPLWEEFQKVERMITYWLKKDALKSICPPTCFKMKNSNENREKNQITKN